MRNLSDAVLNPKQPGLLKICQTQGGELPPPPNCKTRLAYLRTLKFGTVNNQSLIYNLSNDAIFVKKFVIMMS